MHTHIGEIIGNHSWQQQCARCLGRQVHIVIGVKLNLHRYVSERHGWKKRPIRATPTSSCFNQSLNATKGTSGIVQCRGRARRGVAASLASWCRASEFCCANRSVDIVFRAPSWCRSQRWAQTPNFHLEPLKFNPNVHGRPRSPVYTCL